MSDKGEYTVAIVALMTSLVALLVALMQMLQQYFATADGYRRSKASTMSGWARFTHRRFIWSEFRFQTTFVVPHISFREIYPGRRETKPGGSDDAGSDEEGDGDDFDDVAQDDEDIFTPWNDSWVSSHTKTDVPVISFEQDEWDEQSYRAFTNHIKEPMTIKGFFQDAIARFNSSLGGQDKIEAILPRSEEQSSGSSIYLPDKRLLWEATSDSATWLELLSLLRDAQYQFTHEAGYIKSDWRIQPVFWGQRCSWDDMVPSVTRPYASISITDLIVVVRLLRMRWQAEFKPLDGILHAEGQFCLLTSSVFPGLGPTVEFRMKRPIKGTPTFKWFIPDAMVYSLMFGIVGADPMVVRKRNGAPAQIKMSQQIGWKLSIQKFGLPFEVQYLPAELIPLISPMYRKTGSKILRIPKAHHGPSLAWLGHPQTYVAFPEQLCLYNGKRREAGKRSSPFVYAVIKHIRTLESNGWSLFWTDGLPAPRHITNRRATRVVRACDFFQEGFEVAQRRVVDILKKTRGNGDLYLKLAFKHIQLFGKIKEQNEPHSRGNKNPATKNDEAENREERPNIPKEKLEHLINQLPQVCRFIQRQYEYAIEKNTARSEKSSSIKPELARLEDWEIEEMYIAMLFRGMCWLRCHVIDREEDAVPGDYWQSRQQIYIM